MTTRPDSAVKETEPDGHYAERWVKAGLLSLTGGPDKPVAKGHRMLVPFDHLVAELETVSAAFRKGVKINEHLLTERAKWLGLTAKGRFSANGYCRILPCVDGWIAVNLAREEDLDLLPAWLESDRQQVAIPETVASKPGAWLTARAALLGLPVAAVSRPVYPEGPDFHGQYPLRGKARKRPLVIDLSTLWAGPLAGQILRQAGCEVVRVESVHRPDPVRESCPGFFDNLHRGKKPLSLNLKDLADRARLKALLLQADAVITSARPRALEQLGICPRQLLADNAKLVYLTITAHGAQGRASIRVGFGDDCAVSGGLYVTDGSGQPAFVSDAIADPLTGIRGAILVLHALFFSRGKWIDLSLSGTARWLASRCDMEQSLPGSLERRGDAWVYRPARVGYKRFSGHSQLSGMDAF